MFVVQQLAILVGVLAGMLIGYFLVDAWHRKRAIGSPTLESLRERTRDLFRR